jgi:multiple sugar transport system permease protein
VRRTSWRRGGWGIYPLLSLAALLTLAPFTLALLGSATTPRSFAAAGPLALPDPWTLENYARVAGGPTDLAGAIVRTALVALTLTVTQLTTAVAAGYAFAKLRFPWRRLLFAAYLATLLVPPILTVIPLYLMMTAAGLRGTFWGVVLPFALASPFAIFLLREHFRSIPDELLDAGRLDGLGPVTVLWHIALPLSRPALVTVALVTVVSQWNSFLWPRLIAGQSYPLITVGVASLQTQYSSNWTLVLAGVTMALVPLLAAVWLAQARFARALVIGGG